MANNFKSRGYIIVVCLLSLMGCNKEEITPVVNYSLQSMENANRVLNFKYNDMRKIYMLDIIDKISGLRTNQHYFYNHSHKLSEVSVGDIKYVIEYDSPNSLNIITLRQPDEKLFKDNLLINENKITQHTHCSWENNQWKAEGKYNYSYYTNGNLHQIELYSTVWNNQWNLYGKYLFKSYDKLINNLADVDFITSFMNFQMPFYIDYFKNSFINNPLEIQSFDRNGNQLLTFRYDYEHLQGLRVKRIQKDFLNNQIIYTDTLVYSYQE